MRREELLGWLGVVLGIPGVVLLLSDRIAAGVLLLVLTAALWWFYWRLNRPPFTVIEVRKVPASSELSQRLQISKLPNSGAGTYLAMEM